MAYHILRRIVILLVALYLFFCYRTYTNRKKLVPNEIFVNRELSSFGGFTPCKYAVATAMCRGKSKGKKAKERFNRVLGQVAVMTKSLLLREKYFGPVNNTKSCIDMIIISDDKIHFDDLLLKLSEDGYRASEFETVRFRFVHAAFPLGCEKFRDLYGPCASIRLFIDKLLPAHDSVVYVDSDVLFFQNIKELWKEFSTFKPMTWAAFGPDDYGIVHHHMPYFGNRGLNSGIAFFNMTRMRKSKFFQKIQIIFKLYSSISAFPDQDFLNFYFYRYSDEAKYLNCGTNFLTTFCVRFCTVKNGIQILHGAAGTFHWPPYDPLFWALFRFYFRTRLDLDISNEEFSYLFQRSFTQSLRTFSQSSICYNNITNFPEIVMHNMWPQTKLLN